MNKERIDKLLSKIDEVVQSSDEKYGKLKLIDVMHLIRDFWTH